MKSTQKKIVASILGAGAIAAATNTTQAKADEAVVDTTAPVATEVATAVNPAQAVESAQQTLNTANQTVANQQAIVDAAQTAVTDQQATIQENHAAVAQAQENAANATPENIAAAEQVVADTQAQVAPAQETVVADNQATVNKEQADVNAAQTAVGETQAIVDGTGAADAIKAAEDAKAQKEADAQAKEQAESNLEAAKTADANREAEIKTAQTDVDAKTSAVNEAKPKADSATAVETTTKATLDSAQAKLDSLESQTKSIPTLYLYQEYVDALRKYTDNRYGSQGYRDAEAILKQKSLELYDKNNYVVNPTDKTRTFDITNVPVEINTELNHYAQTLINQIREQFGTQLSSVSQMSMNFATAVAAEYTKDQKSITSGHNIRALNAAASKVGLTESDQNVYENLNNITVFKDENAIKQSQDIMGVQYDNGLTRDEILSDGSISVATAKELIYNSIKNFMLNTLGEEWHHANSIAGLRDLEGESGDNLRLGVSLSKAPDGYRVHVLNYVDHYLMHDKADMDIMRRGGTLGVTPKSPEEIAAIHAADTIFENPLDAKDLVAKLNQAKSDVTTAESVYNQAKATPEQTPGAQAQLDQATKALEASTAKSAEADKAVELLNADIKEKQAALEQAKQTLAKETAELNAAKDVLSKANDKLAELKAQATTAANDVATKEAELKAIQDQIVEKQEYVAALKEAPERLAAAEKALNDSRAVLIEKLTVLNTELKKLDELKGDAFEAQTAYDEAVKAYNVVLENERIVKEAQKRLSEETLTTNQTKQSEASTATEVTTKPVATTDVAKQSDVSPLKSDATLMAPSHSHELSHLRKIHQASINGSDHSDSLYGYSRMERHHRLPSTGDNNSVLTLMGFGLLSVLGLEGVRKGKRKY